MKNPATPDNTHAGSNHESWFDLDDDRCLKDLLPCNALIKHPSGLYNPSPPDALTVAA